MKRRTSSLLALCFWGLIVSAQVPPPDSLVLQNIPPVSQELQDKATPYLEARTAIFRDWDPSDRQVLITTRFADTMQLHRVRFPGAQRFQLTFLPEPISDALFSPETNPGPESIVFSQDRGGGEFFQFYKYALPSGKVSLLTDGKSRNTGPRYSRSGHLLAFTSTRRNGADTDIYTMDPRQPGTTLLRLEVKGGGWSVQDWSKDETQLLLQEYISITKSHLHLFDLRSRAVRRITPSGPGEVAFDRAMFGPQDRTILATTDMDSEFMRLAEFEFPEPGQTLKGPARILSSGSHFDVDEFDLTDDRGSVAFVVNENGIAKLHALQLKDGKELKVPRDIYPGVISGLRWHSRLPEVAFTFSSAQASSDTYSANLETGTLTRWTESEIGGLNAKELPSPELITLDSFDGVKISAFVYRPDPRKFPGKRPALVYIHGGPESQYRPGFIGRNNYYLNEMGVALVFPNVRGSSGYGKTFLRLDNGFKREDSVRDIGAILDWIGRDGTIDSGRVGLIGGSYGGYMVLAGMIHFGERVRCGVDVVGISSFLTFLKNTQEYRRDLRRAEYGDERDPEMRNFLEKISPTSNTAKITKPLLVVQGKNDPRVPVTESEQMVQAIQQNGGKVWYLMAKDEGHGFGKKKNADFQFLVTIQFLQQYLLD